MQNRGFNEIGNELWKTWYARIYTKYNGPPDAGHFQLSVKETVNDIINKQIEPELIPYFHDETDIFLFDIFTDKYAT